MSKYNDFMSHIRVDDEMHRRIMNAVSEAIEQGSETKPEDILSTHFKTSYASAEISPLNSEEEDRVKTPIKRKAKVSVIRIISIAAAAILVIGGAVMISTRTMGSTKSFTVANEAAQATSAAEVDGALKVNGNGNHLAGNNKSYASVAGNRKTITTGSRGGNPHKKAEEGAQEETIEGIDQDEAKTLAPSMAPTEAEEETTAKRDIKDSLPFKVRTVGSGSLKGNITTTVYTGVNGEKMILFKAAAGTDIVKAYYPDFKGKPALLQTEGGQVFNAVDLSAGKNEQVKNNVPFDAVTWTKDGSTYMLMFSTKQDVQIFISLMELI